MALHFGIWRRLRPYWHSTGSLFCPVCEHQVRSFTPLDRLYADKWKQHGFDLSPYRWETFNAQEMHCPLCSCLDRERLIALYLDSARDSLPTAGRLIEFAPNALAPKLKRLFRHWTIRTADLFASNADDVVDICDMPIYKDDSVDFFICCHVLEHVADDAKAARELYRILKPGGRAAVLVPIHLDLRSTRSGPPITGKIDPQSAEADYRWCAFGQYDHARLHSRSGFIELLTSAGFQLDFVTRKDFPKGRFEQCGISRTSVLYVASKSIA